MNETISKIERILVTKLRPNFLTIEYVYGVANPFIHIVLSCKSFSKKTIDERIATVFNVLVNKDSSIVENNAIVVETFDSTEMRDIFEYIRG